MTTIRFNDVIDLNTQCRKRIEDYNRTKGATSEPEDLPYDLKDKMVSDLKDCAEYSNRMSNFISLDHCLFSKKEYNQEFDIEIKNVTEGDVNFNYQTLPLVLEPFIMNDIYDYYDMFVVTKICVEFESTQTNNIATIFCKYLAPPSLDSVPVQYIVNATKEADTKNNGINGGSYMTVNNPFFVPYYEKAGSMGAAVSKTIYDPCPRRGMISSNVPNYKYDFGTLGIYTYNNDQSGVLRIKWCMELYSSVNYSSVTEETQTKKYRRITQSEGPVSGIKAKRIVKGAK